jgi:hypothetical protein
VNLAVGIVLSLIPEWKSSKNQVSVAYILIATGVKSGHILVFAVFDRILNWDLAYLRAFGKNPLLMYFIMGFTVFLLRETVGFDFGISIWGNFISLCIILAITSTAGWVDCRSRVVLYLS